MTNRYRHGDWPCNGQEADPEILIDGIEDLVYVTNPQRRIVYANASFARLFGYSSKRQLIGRPIESCYVVPSHRRLLEETLELLHGTVQNYVVLVKKRNGDRFYLSVDSNWIGQDKDLGIEGTGRDITQLIMLLQGFFQLRQDGIITFCSAQFANLLGYAREEEIIGRHIGEISQAPKAWPPFRDSERLKPGQVKSWKDSCTRRDGRQVVLGITVQLLSHERDSPVSYQGTAKDITQAEAAERSLIESSRMNEILMDNSWDGVYLIQGDRFLRTSDSLCSLLGHPPGYLAGKPFLTLVSDQDAEVVSQRLAEELQADVPTTAEYEFRAVTRTGQIRSVRVKSSRCDYQGRMSIYGYLRDITEEKERVAELSRKVEVATSELNRALEEKGLLLAAAVHEMNSPIASIRGAVDVIRHEIPPGKRFIHSRLEDMDLMCELMSAVVRNVQLAQVRSFKRTYRSDWIRLEDDVIKNALRLMKWTIADRGLPENIRVNLRSAPAYVLGSRELLLQVMFNLFSNAVKYARDDPAAFQIEIECKPRKNGDIVLFVRDSGIGIPSGESAQIFKNGVKGSNAQSVPGMGLGLWVVKSVLEDFGCKVVVAKRENPTTFAITLPAAMLSSELVSRR